MRGCLWAMGLICIWYIPKAAAEMWFFNDRHDARKTLFHFLLSEASIAFALYLSFLFDWSAW